MSRVGNMPIKVPPGVSVNIAGSKVDVKGSQGELQLCLPPVLSVEHKADQLLVKRKAENKRAKALHGLHARLLANMVTGVSDGFEKRLEIIGIGYRAKMEGENLVMQLGFSHPVRYTPPAGVRVSAENKGLGIVVNGCDKQAVGEAAARIRRFRPPEPYKGKGIRYQGERVRRKAGKAIA